MHARADPPVYADHNIMEASAELLLGVSLDSVVDKAAELEKLLRDCKHAALDEITSSAVTEPLEGRDRLHGDTVNVELKHLASPTQQPNTEVGLAVHWHRLSSYIVRLEKELHHYRRLVEDGRGRVGFRTVSQAESGAEAAQEPAIVRLRASETTTGGEGSKTNESGLLQRVTQSERPLSVVSHGKDERGRGVFAADQLFWKKLLEG